MKIQFTSFINGQFSVSNSIRKLIQPHSGLPFVDVIEATPAQVNIAVNSAYDALSSEWSKVTSSQRRDILHSIALKIEKNKEYLSNLESLNTGKPIKQAIGDIQATIECFKYFSGYADKVSGRNISVDPKYSTLTVCEPIGVCAIIVSFNYPLLLAAWKIAPALAMGNTIVLKPAPQTPLTALYFAHLLADILPKGVFNVIPGQSDVGKALVEHSLVSKISFTGSTATGSLVAKSCSDFIRPLTLELGGKNSLIVCADADLDMAVEGVIDAAFANAGQNCCAGSKLYIEEKIYVQFLEKLRIRAIELVVGTDIGPLIDEQQKNRVQGFIDRATKENIKKLLDYSYDYPTNGYFIPPTIFYDVKEDAEIAKNEIFGPVLAIMEPWTDIKDAIKLVNSTPYGLGAGIWTSSIKSSEYASRNIKVGMIWINCYNDNPAYLPFGGRKMSGYDQLFASLAVSGATLVGKAAFSIATNAAVKKIQSFVESPSSSDHLQLQEIKTLHQELEIKLNIINPVIDIFELMAPKENTSITLLTNSLRKHLLLVEAEQDLTRVISTLKVILQDISGIAPFLQLALQSLSFLNKIDSKQTISISRLLNASNSILYPKNSIIGDMHSVKIYSLFMGSARKNSKTNFTWKEEYNKGFAQFEIENRFKFNLCLMEDLDDGRYHDDEEITTKSYGFKCGRVRKISVSSISSFYYSNTGSLLQIENSESPVIVFKIQSKNSGDEWWAIEEFKDGKKDIEQKKLLDMEYILRLLSLEEIQKMNHLKAPDGLIESYLLNQFDPHKDSAEKVQTILAKNHESPLSKSKFIDRLKESSK